MSIHKPILFLIFSFNIFITPQRSYALEGLKLMTDIYASHTHLMPYKGYQDDISGTLYFQYQDQRLVPFVRALSTNFYYQTADNTDFISDHRTSLGIGLDYKMFSYLKLRYIYESIHNKNSDTTSGQSGYGIIYNQYFDLAVFELNNYAESFYIPEVSTGSMDTFARLQALKSFYLLRSDRASHALYPFLQIKAKINDDANFGLSGQNASVGGGYKFYAHTTQTGGSFSAVIEGHSIIYQSEDFRGDWLQTFAALQWMIN